MKLSDFAFSTLGEFIRDLSSFDCGRKSINDFFRNEALDYQSELFGKTYLLTHRNDLSKVAAAFTVANASLFTRLLPNSRLSFYANCGLMPVFGNIDKSVNIGSLKIMAGL